MLSKLSTQNKVGIRILQSLYINFTEEYKYLISVATHFKASYSPYLTFIASLITGDALAQCSPNPLTNAINV